MDKMLWEHILQRKNMSILIDKDPFRLALRVLKIFELIQKSRRGQARKNVPRILKYCCLNFEMQDDCFCNLSMLNF